MGSLAMTGVTTPLQQSTEQLRFAQVLAWGTRAGVAVLALSFVAYLLGLVPAWVAPQRLTEVWSQPLTPYLALTGTPDGWGWATLLRHGDMASLAGIAMLCACALPALLSLVPLALRRGERRLAALCVAQAAVLVLAASGLIVA
jgi:hypothetical protein